MFVAWNMCNDSGGFTPHGLLELTPPRASLGMAVGDSSRTTTARAGSLTAVCEAPPWGPRAAAVLAAYGRSREAFARELGCEWIAVVLDERTGTLIAAAPLTSRPPIAYARVPGGTLVSSHVLELLRHPAVSRALDEKYLAHIVMAFCCPPAGTTALRGVRRLLPGQVLLVRDGVPKVLQMDRLGVRAIPKRSLPECREAFWETLQQSIRKRVVPGAHPCLSLSGGIDSVTVAVALNKMGRATSAFSMVAEGQPDESEGVRVVETALGSLSVTRVDCRGSFDPQALEVLPLADDPVLMPLPLLPAFLRLAVAMRDAGFNMVLQGEGGDEIFCVSPAHAVRRLRWRTAAKHLRAERAWRALFWRSVVLPHLPSALRRPWYRRWARHIGHLPSYLARSPSDDALFSDTMETYFHSLVHRPMREAVESWLGAPIFMGYRVAQERMLQHVGLEVAAPLVDRELIELALSFPAEYMISAEYDKAFLRRVLDGIIPERVRLLPKDLRLFRVLLRDLVTLESSRAALSDPLVRRRLDGWVRFDEVDRIAMAIEAGHEPSWWLLWQLECLISFAHWYRRASREYGVD